MLPEKIDIFIDEHIDKPLSEYIRLLAIPFFIKILL
ncbi:hypothetical protein MSROBK_002220 [Spiroplasma poulsonii]|uniref:Uncharacterized protein n=1 Tax=Spiroplasma poulsonii TaxID=2138 RepID=A0A2P6FAI0_9MOLU|nr:hypothetical protein MSROBK_002490 [Spiroplasma poulsonii]KAF0851956.1 hypothetical protein MSROBK_002220 [Spiroplasma poulsonii]PQM30458.1 hypothetical protein SMSRO_SF002200 [Spiroplasma poulsonii]PWF95426.1 hypothetical protein SMSE_08520 [Spiroplasma poulsonii]PWF98210.1 hypothetical protein SMH99_07610 [Spiroplasma poulsonii]